MIYTWYIDNYITSDRVSIFPRGLLWRTKLLIQLFYCITATLNTLLLFPSIRQQDHGSYKLLAAQLASSQSITTHSYLPRCHSHRTQDVNQHFSPAKTGSTNTFWRRFPSQIPGNISCSYCCCLPLLIPAVDLRRASLPDLTSLPPHQQKKLK